MTNKNLHELFRKANSRESDIKELAEIIELGDEALCAAVALNPSCNKTILDSLSSLDMKEVNRNLLTRYTTYPRLYSLEVREIRVSDAEYILKLRVDEAYSKYISKIDDDVDAQIKYIRKYIEDNSRNRESFYFILVNSATGDRCGAVRIYNFNDDVFEWGSWILAENKSRYAAMDTAILIYEFAFTTLGFNSSEFEVNKNNGKVVSYHKKSGAQIIREDDVNYYFRVNKEIGLQFASTLRDRLEAKLQ